MLKFNQIKEKEKKIMEERFTYLKKEELEEKLKKLEENHSLKLMLSDFLTEMGKKGHKVINKKIEEEFKNFLIKRNFKFNYVYYCVGDRRYGSTKFFDRTLSLTYNYRTDNCNSIKIKNGWEDKFEGGYYDNLFEINKFLIKENIERNYNEDKAYLLKALEELDNYNTKLNELVKLRDSFGYLAL